MRGCCFLKGKIKNVIIEGYIKMWKNMFYIIFLNTDSCLDFYCGLRRDYFEIIMSRILINFEEFGNVIINIFLNVWYNFF